MKIDRLKYRWYSKKYKKICEVNSIEPNNGFVNFQLSNYNDITTAIKDDNGYLLECTGRKDRNGKLIYQGDIVRLHFVSDTNEDDYEDLEVRYDENFMCWGLYDKEHNYFDDSALGADEFKSEDFEIIGNINEGVIYACSIS